MVSRVCEQAGLPLPSSHHRLLWVDAVLSLYLLSLLLATMALAADAVGMREAMAVVLK